MTHPQSIERDNAIESAFELGRDDECLSAVVAPEFSNAPASQPPEKGFPFGGLLAALCANAMRQGLEINAPLRTLSVQYLASAQYGQPIHFRPRTLRGGRRITFAAVEASQGETLTHHATATYGMTTPNGHPLKDGIAIPPALESIAEESGLEGPFAPRFMSQVEFRFENGPKIFGGNSDRPRCERLWMRMRDGSPLDELRLCYLLDALYPPSWGGYRKPPMMTTVDLRYDFITPPTQENTPDGWAFFEYRLIDHDFGWALDDATCWAADGSVLATSRQRRKVLSPEH